MTNRTHCITWDDYSSQPVVDYNDGVRLDTSYYMFPASWDRPSGLHRRL